MHLNLSNLLQCPFAGSGKTMLVQSLTTKIDVAGGYVLTQKLDQMSRERPLLKVLSLFNRLCLMIRERNSAQDLLEVSNKIAQEFATDFSLLSRLLPNVRLLCPQLREGTTSPGAEENYSSIHFVIQRFVRMVSSASKPVCLVLDDLQWVGSTTLHLIESIVLDSSSCCFFIGTYRHHEVERGHPLFTLISNLMLGGTRVTEVQLDGLNQDDLNCMISEMLRLFPRLCKSLSDIIFQNTRGSPYFAMEFLKTLIDKRELKYSLRKRTWIWDEGQLHSENITDNVLHLLSERMSSLPANVQNALSTLSCFGIKVHESIISYLRSSTPYFNLMVAINNAMDEGYIQKKGSEYKFPHDRVREAAYGLILPESRARVRSSFSIFSSFQ